MQTHHSSLCTAWLLAGSKVTEHTTSSEKTQHVLNNQSIDPSHQGFVKGRSCLTNLSFYDRVPFLVNEGKAMDDICLEFTKAFYTISHSIILEKLAAHGLYKHTLHWLRNIRLDGWVQIVVK